MRVVAELSCDVGKKSACEALSIPRATFTGIPISGKMPARTIGQFLLLPWQNMSRSRSSMNSILNGSGTILHRKSMQPCWMRGPICALSGPCTASWTKTMRSRNAGSRLAGLTMKSRNFWLLLQIRFGHGISPN
jgi:hypothetical protein